MSNINDKIFCKNFVNDLKDPIKYPHTPQIYKKMCTMFEEYDCEQYYESDQDSLKLVETKCDEFIHNEL